MANIGKNIIDIITLNLYDDHKAIFREYIQNSADAIDNAVKTGLFSSQCDGEISIILDKNERAIIIEDNATGVKNSEISKRLVDIANSDKDRETNKGFFGIGRLTGLSCCAKLIFETSYAGEDIKTIVEMDSQKARSIIFDPDDHSYAEEVIDKMSSINTQPEDRDKHYFKVLLKGVKNIEEDILFDKKVVRDYLCIVAPVPYDRTFQYFFNGKILPYVEKNKLKLDVYNLYVNNEQIKKCYNTSIYDKNANKLRNDEVKDLRFMEFHTIQGELLAWGWHSITNFDGQIPNVYQNRARGIRFRKHNIQIGNEETLKKYHKEDRGYAYFFGEIHIVHKALLPNAQRNDFTQNETYQVFQKELKKKFLELFDYYQDASKIRSACEAIKKVEVLQSEIGKKKFLDNEEKAQFTNEIKKVQEEAQKKQKFLNNKKEEVNKDEVKAKIFDNILSLYNRKQKNISKIDIDEVEQATKKSGYLFDELSKLSNKEKKLVSKVFGVIANNLPDKKIVSLLADKIKEEFK